MAAVAPEAEGVITEQPGAVAEVVGGEVKLDASEFDGCWLELPKSGLWCCCDTMVHAQKHIDADTVVSKAVELTVLAACLPCFCPCLTWVCCPQKYLGLRAADGGTNSFDYIHLSEGDGRPPKISVDDPWAPVNTRRRRGYDADENDSDDEEGRVLLDAKGFERFGELCHTGRSWRYGGGSRATITCRPRAGEGGAAKGKATASRLAQAWCFAPSAYSRHDRLFAAFYAGYHGEGDRPLPSAEQDDKEACVSTFAGALKSGNVPMLRRYRAVVGGLAPAHTNTLAANGHFAALKWTLDEGVELDPNVGAAAAGSGHLELLTFCKEKGAPLDHRLVCEQAVKSRSLECVEYCHKNGAPWSNKTLSLVVMFGAHGGPDESRSSEVLKYCLDNGAPENAGAIESACRGKALEFVKVFAESSHPFPSGPKRFELFDYNKKVCDEIAEICAGKGYSVSYSQYVSDGY